jgi:hypothetical protein
MKQASTREAMASPQQTTGGPSEGEIRIKQTKSLEKAREKEMNISGHGKKGREVRERRTNIQGEGGERERGRDGD